MRLVFSTSIYEVIVSLFSLEDCPPPRHIFGYVLEQTEFCRAYNEYMEIRPILWTPFEWTDTLAQNPILSVAIITCYVISFSSLSYCLLLALNIIRKFDLTQVKANLIGSSVVKLEDYRQWRRICESTPLPPFKIAQNHPHGDSASKRAAAGTYATHIATMMGKVPYYYQQSKTDQDRNRLGSRSYYWSKDYTAAARNDDVPGNALMVLIDVDYYVDMEKLLANNTAPICLYTFQPTTAGAQRIDYSYSFSEDTVTYRTTGGGTYTHQVWNYNLDVIDAVERFCYTPVNHTVYSVFQKHVDEDHILVFLIPISRWGFPHTMLSTSVELSKLQRHKLSSSGFNRLRVQTADGIVISTSVENQENSATIPASLDEEILNSAKLLKSGLTAPTIGSMLARENIDAPNNKSKILALHAKQETVISNVSPPKVYHYDSNTRDSQLTEPKESLEPFMNNITVAPFAPMRSLANDKRMIEARVTTQKSNVTSDSVLVERMQEFVKTMIPDEGKIFPTDSDTVWEKQNRPTQRSIIERASVDEPKAGVKAFMKLEPYPSAKDPRNISTIDGALKVAYSKYMYAFADYLKTTDWYAFGRTPKDLAVKVANDAQCSENVVSSDGHRFDGHVSAVARDLERAVLARMFHQSTHEELFNLHSKQYNTVGYTTFGVCYDTDCTRLSGSPETSNFNSLLNKFIAFCAHREKLDTETAYHTSGVYGGDDGLTFNMDANLLKRWAARCGQIYESETSIRGQPLQFLSRKYTKDIWHGRTDSTCDLTRTLRGFNVTSTMPDGPIPKLLEKSRGYYLTDRNTPIIGDIVKRVMALTHGALLEKQHTSRQLRWGSELPFEEQYPNDLDDSDCHDIPVSYDLQALRMWLNSTTTLEEILLLPRFDNEEPKFDEGVLINSEIQVESKTVVFPTEILESDTTKISSTTKTHPNLELVKVESLTKRMTNTANRNNDRIHHFNFVVGNRVIKKNCTYLDIGSGDCTITESIGHHISAKKILAYDPPCYSDSCPKSVTRIQHLTDIEGHVDVATFFMSLHHVEKPQELLSKVLRCMSNDGIIIVREHDFSQDIVGLLKIAHDKHCSKLPTFYLTKTQLEQLFERHCIKGRTSVYKDSNPLRIYTTAFTIR